MYADRLQENGQEDRAEFIRLQIAIAKELAQEPVGEDRTHRTARRLGRHKEEAFLAWFHGDRECRCLVCLMKREKELTFDAPDKGRHLVPAVPPEWNLKFDRDTDRYDRPTAFVGRGFVTRVSCSAADWLAHADELIWDPEQTAVCPKCRGFGGDVSGWSCKSCSGPLHRVPCPCPPTAQPIRRVVLTTIPESDYRPDGMANLRGGTRKLRLADYPEDTGPTGIILALLRLEWPGIEFVLPT